MEQKLQIKNQATLLKIGYTRNFTFACFYFRAIYFHFTVLEFTIHPWVFVMICQFALNYPLKCLCVVYLMTIHGYLN